jgi:hypothetical protein
MSNELINLNNSSEWQQFADGKYQGYTKASQNNSVIVKGSTIIDIQF